MALSVREGEMEGGRGEREGGRGQGGREGEGEKRDVTGRPF